MKNKCETNKERIFRSVSLRQLQKKHVESKEFTRPIAIVSAPADADSFVENYSFMIILCMLFLLVSSDLLSFDDDCGLCWVIASPWNRSSTQQLTRPFALGLADAITKQPKRRLPVLRVTSVTRAKFHSLRNRGQRNGHRKCLLIINFHHRTQTGSVSMKSHQLFYVQITNFKVSHNNVYIVGH